MATGTKLAFADIEQLWISNGGPAGWAPLMAGIAMAESGGSTVALNNNPSTGDYSVGLWQINYYGNLLASRTNSYGSPAALQADPNLQAKAAISLFGGGPGITNWKGDATYNKWVASGSPSQPSAATVEGWVGGAGSSGTASATTATGSAAGGAKGVAGNDLSTCVFSFPGFLFFSGPCIITKGGVKWLSGVAALAAGVGIGAFGVIMLAAYGFDASGARQAVGKVAGALPGPVGEAAKVANRSGASSGSGRSTRRALPTPQAPKAAPPKAPAPTPEIPIAGRRESRQIERQYQSAQRQQGPIGPRGGNPTANRVAARERRGTSVPGARRPNRDSMPF